MKDALSRVERRAVPYGTITPRRALRELVGVTHGGRIVRQANSSNPACSLNQTLLGHFPYERCSENIGRDRQRVFLVTGGGWDGDPTKIETRYRRWTCAKIACATGRAIEQSDYVVLADRSMHQNDTRCFVSRPPSVVVSNQFRQMDTPYDKINGTKAMELPAARYNDGIVVDLPIEACNSARTNTAILRELQSKLGLSAIPAAPVAPVATITPSSSLLATAGSSLLATAAAFIAPTPTATIAATAPNATVSNLAIGLGALGSGVTIAGAVYSVYKLANYLARKPPQNTASTPENVIELARIEAARAADPPPAYPLPNYAPPSYNESLEI